MERYVRMHIPNFPFYISFEYNSFWLVFSRLGYSSELSNMSRLAQPRSRVFLNQTNLSLHKHTPHSSPYQKRREMFLPPGSAGPNEVRAYITQILISKHDAALDVAQQIANQWQFGRPNDLRRAGMKLFNQVFGTEVGTSLFRTVQEDIEAEWRGSTAGLVNYCMLKLKGHPPVLSLGDRLTI